METNNKIDLNAQIQPSFLGGVKCRFFSQYYGVKCMYISGVGLVKVGSGAWNLKHPDFFLKLKPLSEITEEDAIEVLKLIYPKTRNIESNCIRFFRESYGSPRVNQYYKEDIERYVNIHPNLERIAIDYLRSKGYALPFMEYSLEDLISFGWMRV